MDQTIKQHVDSTKSLMGLFPDMHEAMLNCRTQRTRRDQLEVYAQLWTKKALVMVMMMHQKMAYNARGSWHYSRSGQKVSRCPGS